MITVLGSGGFIGSHIVKRLQSDNVPYFAPSRGEPLARRHLGQIIYCIGLTADFRSRPFDTLEAHVCNLLEIIRTTEFDRLLYLSSTRLYQSCDEIAYEDTCFEVNPLHPGDLYNVSKAAGEALVAACGKRGKIARLSNVYGGDFRSSNFLASVLTDAVSKQKVVLNSSLESEKDYVSIDTVVDILLEIATNAKETLYNVASGTNVTHRELMDRISRLTGCEVLVSADAQTTRFPRISIERIRSEFVYTPSNVLTDLEKTISLYKAEEGISQ